MEYSQITKDFGKTLGKEKKSKQGIFFTPKSVREKLFGYVDDPKNILEPSCGTGEIILDCIDRFPSANITGVELDEDIYDICKRTYTRENVTIINDDFLAWKGEKFDFIVGNPPFVVRPKGHKNDDRIVRGRSNLYVEFLFKCITEHLEENGIIAFVIPSTIGNSKFYEPIRKLITNMDILSFEVLDKHAFCDTKTRLCILVVRNTLGTGRFVYKDFLCDKDISHHSSECLGDLNLKFKTGFAWANVRKFFTDTSNIPFLTSGNVKFDEIQIGEKTKYLSEETTKFFTGKALLIKTASAGKRGGKFEFGFSMYENDKWAADNDIIIIQGSDDDLSRVRYVLLKEETNDFINNLVNNGHINMKTLKCIPI
ncbi:adenine-specific methyltransferase [Paramecium bursaria Chlorella virus IL-5-2s1]|nr:adenine-specific methyltransferase [Paramecium bursaria Chlorella virus IL-5-2s1]